MTEYQGPCKSCVQSPCVAKELADYLERMLEAKLHDWQLVKVCEAWRGTSGPARLQLSRAIAATLDVAADGVTLATARRLPDGTVHIESIGSWEEPLGVQ